VIMEPNGSLFQMDDDAVFKALADASRRQLLDRLYRKNGQTLGELCEGLNMTRQAVAKHLAILKKANLLSWKRDGRERIHFINPVPIHDITERWIRKFEQPRLHGLAKLKRNLEGKDHE
jgi:DNA-binding transcriptional ArsR family regulator